MPPSPCINLLPDPVKPRLLVLELWGLGDLVIASPFLQAASQHYEVTLVAKPFARELHQRLWPAVNIELFTAPWTAFEFGDKYQFWYWPWQEILDLRRRLRSLQLDYAVSARWDPRDHFVLKHSGAARRLGFSRLSSHRYLTDELPRPHALAHRYEYWCQAALALGLNLPAREHLPLAPRTHQNLVLLHSGARLPARVWPLENFRTIAGWLRAQNHQVVVACDPDQLDWWQTHGEHAICPRTVTELLGLVDRSAVFLGNCSGPGHLAAICGVPTFTVYGPSLHEWFRPLHPAAEVYEGHGCPYKPCSDYCRYDKPFCLQDVTAGEVWPAVEKFMARHLPALTGKISQSVVQH